jgi:hypothetical protein
MEKVNVFITVDTEHSIGGAFEDSSLKPVGNEKRVFGKLGKEHYGIPLIMDIAEIHGIQLTFFVEVLNKYYFGQKETRDVCEYILNRGHDIQLHLHPNYLSFVAGSAVRRRYSDLIGTYSLSEQTQLIEDGVKTLIEYGVSHPIAFRAGCFGANKDTLLALKRNGIWVDSSYNQAYIGNACLLDDLKINDANYVESIWEFPVTNFLEKTRLRRKRFVPLDMNGVSFPETKYVLNWAGSKGVKNAIIILHSFSFIKHYDVQYQKIKPRIDVIKRFKKVCEYINENRDFYQVRTLGSLTVDEMSGFNVRTNGSFPEVPPQLSILRAIQQLKDRIF